MRVVSRRFRARLLDVNRWITDVSWSNDGGITWTPCEFLAGTVTAASTSQIRWSCSLTVRAPEDIDPFSTRLRVLHGMAGEPLLPMGVYKVTQVERTDEDPERAVLTGASFECYLIGARFPVSRTFRPQPARELVTNLIREVLPRAQVSWQVPANPTLPKIVEPRDRWPLLDGDRDSVSIARSLGARIYAGPSGEWIVDQVPALTDPPVWEARRGEALLSASETLSDDGVYNMLIVNSQATGDGPVVAHAIAQDLDPLSPTYVGRSPDSGGFGRRPRFYASQFIRTKDQAAKAAQGLLAPYLGLRQQVAFATLHDPSMEPGDVGIVHTRRGPRRVILDSVTYSLDGAPLQAETRTTATREAGTVYAAPTVEGDQET